MNPFVVIDAQQQAPNRFALALAAAARARALNRGAAPRLPRGATPSSEHALHELAAGAITAAEIDAFLLASPLEDKPEQADALPFSDGAQPEPERDAAPAVPPPLCAEPLLLVA